MARDVDLVILNDSPPQLSRHIMTRGLRLMISNASADHDFLRMVLSRAADLATVPELDPAPQAGVARSMTYLVERLVELKKHVDHLRDLSPKISREAIESDLSLHNDMMFSLLMMAQLVIDLAGELSARRGGRFEDYVEAVRNLAKDARFPKELVTELERLPGLRNVVIHDYVPLDMTLVIQATRNLEPVERFLDIVRQIEGGA